MSGNYSLEFLEERAAEAKVVLRDHIERLEGNYIARDYHRKCQGILPVAFNGMSRAGKDTAAKHVDDVTEGRIRYGRSSSWHTVPIIAHMVGVSAEELYAKRHEHREFMIAAFHAIRGEDYLLTVRMSLGAGDMVVGIRGGVEMAEVVRTGIVALNVWVANDRVPNDITVEYEPNDCDVVMPNHGSLEEFHGRVERFVRAFYR